MHKHEVNYFYPTSYLGMYTHEYINTDNELTLEEGDMSSQEFYNPGKKKICPGKIAQKATFLLKTEVPSSLASFCILVWLGHSSHSYPEFNGWGFEKEF